MYIVSISIEHREKCVPEVQEVLTRYGENISTRLGIHNPEKENTGVIILSYVGENVEEIAEELNGIPEVTANFMEI